MNTKFDLEKLGQGIVYVKPILATDLPEEMRERVGDLEELFSVHNADGEQLALVADRKLAFHLARENNMQPVTVH
ncbi:hypothetical protein C7964_101696 [Loktanella sp. PT4BL]|jgi:hypothetical protein|uniref:DUF1150 family protein n=1 Tax=Yoonia rosea TaxID=287098 RepID=A0A1R3XIY2_9RHOB|nr:MULTISPECIES: DUF1150 family protein [Rhodobacterales]PXW72582.1 hypothetical protein C7964_101696 [Loktanella sp. PT4BL]SIT91481.1 hypothetical protein SAMN05421665_3377 [Yoonia rosea]HEV8037052.1 DUF1150 family protein [Yoonia sp.]